LDTLKRTNSCRPILEAGLGPLLRFKNILAEKNGEKEQAFFIQINAIYA
jgi:hypothetical protein